ncbi:MAG: hypothetical protein H7195_12135 [Chryseobacterium sp.]|nr:hypothetical protein [Chryseobacterium sp.]
MDKQTLLNKIIEEQQKIIENLETNVERFRKASDLDEDSTLSPQDFSHQTEAKDMQLRFEKMLNSSQHDLNFLQNLSVKKLDGIEKGSVIETEKFYFFVGVSTANFKFAGKEMICFTEEAPIFKKIQHKNTGESFKMGNQDLTILNIV